MCTPSPERSASRTCAYCAEIKRESTTHNNTPGSGSEFPNPLCAPGATAEFPHLLWATPEFPDLAPAWSCAEFPNTKRTLRAGSPSRLYDDQVLPPMARRQTRSHHVEHHMCNNGCTHGRHKFRHGGGHPG